MNTVSVVMATYNGERFIEKQLDSIIPFLDETDELIISDDGSKDRTCEIIKGYIAKYPIIKLYDGPKQGVVKNFENAIRHASKEIVLFSDQDDYWMPEKIPVIKKVFSEYPTMDLVLHDKYICSSEQVDNDEFGEPSILTRKWHHGVLFNILYSCYYGCCMAMRKDFIDSILPFPESTLMYDQLIGLVAERRKKSLFIPDVLIKRRLHGGNMGQQRSVSDKFKYRLSLIKSYMEVIGR